MLDEVETEVRRLRNEVKNATVANANLGSALAEMEDRENIFADTLATEKVKLQAALERVNGERLRLAYELSDLKRRFGLIRSPTREQEFVQAATSNGRAA
jgi:hypothetical protein